MHMRSFAFTAQQGGAALIFGSAMLTALPARADSIDGKWCSEDGKRRIEIQGSKGIWGRGVTIDGKYFRYTYLFDMPAGEADAGQPVEMRFRRADQSMLVRIGAGDQKVWRTCLPEIS